MLELLAKGSELRINGSSFEVLREKPVGDGSQCSFHHLRRRLRSTGGGLLLLPLSARRRRRYRLLRLVREATLEAKGEPFTFSLSWFLLPPPLLLLLLDDVIASFRDDRIVETILHGINTITGANLFSHSLSPPLPPPFFSFFIIIRSAFHFPSVLCLRSNCWALASCI